ncbi:MAG TPA: hypothetical protein VI636_06910 [Candidatus Angelobacter sp.]
MAILAVWISAATLMLTADLAGQQASEPVRIVGPHYQTNFLSLATDGGWQYWDKGYLITWAFSGKTLSVTPDQPAVVLYDSNGGRRDAYVWLEGAERVAVGSAAVTPSGKLMVAGGTQDAHGVIAHYIAEVGDNDHVSRVVRTTPFIAVSICSSRDDRVWAYGFERDENGKSVENAPMLREYDFEKGQLRATLYPANLNPGWSLPNGRYPGEITLRCNSKSVGIYNARSSEWVQFDLSANTLKVVNVDLLPPTSRLHITGFALTESGEVFASFHDRSKGPPVSGIFKLTLDAGGSGRWAQVEGTVGPYLGGSATARLMGADGDDLVHTRKLDGKVFWSKYEKASNRQVDAGGSPK